MSSASKEQYYTTGSVGRSRRGSPGDTNSAFFQGQGGRTVLPPISSAFPTSLFPVPSNYSTAYTQPRSSPSRFMLSNPAFYGPWPTGNSSPTLPDASFANYEPDRYNAAQASYTTYPSARSSPPLQNSVDSRRLPPLSTGPPTGGERWQQGPYQITTSNYPTTSSIRSPTASYPSAYVPYSSTGHAYTYLPETPLDVNAVLFDYDPTRPEPRAASPYRPPPADYTPAPISPTSPEEPTIKKKRKRADANQLKVLNEVYARTAFPSTEERNALAKQLDMSPRSVQIWFQNKRQSMRQTNRQTANSSSLSQQPYPISTSINPHSASSRAAAPLSESSYITASSQDHVRTHHSSSPQRRLQAQEDTSLDPRKWTSTTRPF